jgi:hypothetical protein
VSLSDAVEFCVPHGKAQFSLWRSTVEQDYRHLSADKLIETAERLSVRVSGKFPSAGLAEVAHVVTAITREAAEKAEKIQQPNWWLRGALIGLALLVAAGAVGVAMELDGKGPLLTRVLEFMKMTQGAAVYLGAAAVFCWTLETRFKRGKAVRAIHELRALAHIIDMHQLSKDPERKPEPGQTVMNLEEMGQYLHYCTELLAIITKLGQLYVQDFPDGTTLAAVDQLENLGTGLSQKIWQKIMILERIKSDEEDEEPPQRQTQA